MTRKQKIVQLLNKELKTDLHKLESGITDGDFHRIENNNQSPNVYFQKDSDSCVIQLLTTTADEKENVSALFVSILSLFEDVNENDLKDEIKNKTNYEKIFQANGKVEISLIRDGNTFSITY